MINLNIPFNSESGFRILCLGAHSDDIEIGCGGTILKLVDIHPDVQFNWIVFGSSGNRAKEAKKSAARFLRAVKYKQIEIKNFRDGYFPYIGGEIKDFFELIKLAYDPDLIFTHYRNDLHQDHRLISELTWNTFRDHLILEYEIPKYDGDVGNPNLFVHLSKNIAQRKINFIMDNFQTQHEKHWFNENTFFVDYAFAAGLNPGQLNIMQRHFIVENSFCKYLEILEKLFH